MAENEPGATPPATDAAATAAAAGAAANPSSQPGAAAAPAGTEGATPPAAAAPAATATPPAAPAAAAVPAGAPEKYAIAIPDGSPLAAEDVAQFETFARAHNLTNEQAQAAFKEHSDAVAANNTRMLTDLQGDPEIGGANLPAVQARTNAVLDKFLPATTPEGAELRAVLSKQGLGNYRPMVKLLNNIAKAMGEDPPLTDRSTGGGGQRSAADILFGNKP